MVRPASDEHTSRNTSVALDLHQIPPEIWREIFAFATIQPMGILPRRTEPRLAISHTCSFWRKTAIDMTELWTNYSITPTAHIWEGRTRPKCIAVMEAVFSRAGNKLLSLTMPSHMSPHAILPLYPIPDLLVPYGDRFHELDVYLSPYHLDPALGTSFEEISFGSARKLSIQPVKFEDSTAFLQEFFWDGSISFRKIAQNLEQLTFILPPWEADLEIQWHQLKLLNLQVDLCAIDTTTLAQNLAECRSLQILTFRVSSGLAFKLEDSSIKLSSPLPCLRYLDIIAEGLEGALAFLQLLSFPDNLPTFKSLGLNIPTLLVPQDVTERSWVRVAKYLERLVVNDCYEGRPRCLQEFLSNPNLKELHVSFYYLFDDSRQPQEYVDQLTYLLEELMSLLVAHRDWYKGGQGGGGDKVLGSGPLPPMKYVRIAHPSYHLTAEHVDIICQLNEGGLKVETVDNPNELGCTPWPSTSLKDVEVSE
ncbi:hypothetical protein AX16_010445 [Volvariella volvacea WC 439]|nr:hypothetical protein AX16_010445 [Volvariella volvacea WC 439]